MAIGGEEEVVRRREGGADTTLKTKPHTSMSGKNWVMGERLTSQVVTYMFATSPILQNLQGTGVSPLN